MRIALVTETFLPKVDGIVNTLCRLLDHLEARGHQSLLFAPEGGPAQVASTPVLSYEGHAFPLYPELKLVPPLVDLTEPLDRFRPDVIHVLNPVSLSISALRYANTRGVPVVASYHTDVPGFAERWGLGMFSPFLWGYFRWLHNQADLNLCPSGVTQRELVAQGFRRVKVWSRGVDTTLFHPRRRTDGWRERLTGGAPDAPLLLYVGRVSMEKRIDWLRPVLDAVPGARLAIVGDGPHRPALEAMFAGTPTVFTGFLSGHELACAYAAADVFVFPAANETLGNVVLEAMASGLPVVAARSGGPLENVVHNETGLFFDPEDPADLLHAVRALTMDLPRARALGAAGRVRVRDRSWASVLDGLLDDYESLIVPSSMPQAA